MSFRIVPGAARSPVILHVPHSSRLLPARTRAGILLDDEAHARELDLMTDAHTLRIASEAAGDAWIFANSLSRLVVDPERFPDDREELLPAGMGAVYTRTSSGAKLRDDDPSLLNSYFHPYAAAFTRLVDERLAATGRAVLIDVHSYPRLALPYELHPSGARPPVCIGTDPFHTPASLVEAARDAFGDALLNTPFSGCYVPLKHYRHDPAVTALMVELRRDTYMVEPGGPPTDGIDGVVAALRRFLLSL